ncbi:MAG: VWA domain-containing protein [Acidobacteriota bacterium]
MNKRNLIAAAVSLSCLMAGLILTTFPAKPQGKIKVPADARPIDVPTKQATPPPRNAAPESDVIFRQNVTFVSAPVAVLDSKGDFINGLTPIDFQLFDKGIPQEITLDVQAHPVSVVVAIQSTSTARQILPTIQKISGLLGDMVAGETGEVAIIGFTDRIMVHSGFTSDPKQIKEGLQKLKPGSTSSHLNDAAMEGVRMLKTRDKNRKRVLILVSETRDLGSAVKVRDVLTEAEFDNIVIYPVDMSHWLNQLTTQAAPNRPNPVPPEARGTLPMGTLQTGTTDAQMNMGNYTPAIREIFTAIKGIFIPNPLEVYSKFTGGREQNFAGYSGLEEAVLNIGRELHNQYILTYLPSNRKDGGYHEIEVRVPSIPNLKIRTRAGYWIAPQN